ncbi:hypothetical protein [Providencia rustigianii]|nr:hypothetical protein [Providencia rustigianii]
MKKFNTVVYCGLVINCLLLGIIWYSTSLLLGDPDLQWTLSYDERRLMEVMSWVKIPFMVAILVQIISLFILDKFPKIGLTIAILSSIIMLPLSLIFITGYLYAYENRTNGSLIEFTDTQADIQILFRTNQIQFMSILYIILGGVIAFLGLGFGWLLFVAGIVTLCNLKRLKNRILIGLDQDNLILTPNLYSKTYLVPFSCVNILKNNDKILKLHIVTPTLDRKITYRKAMLAGEDFNQILTHILSKISGNDLQSSSSSTQS